MDDADAVATPGGAVLSTLRRHWLLVLGCVLVVPAIALLVSLGRPKQYEATAGLLFEPTNVVQGVLGTPSPVSIDPAREAATDVQLVASPDVAKRTARAIGSGATAGDVSRHVSVAAAGETNIVTVTSTAADPRAAAFLANLYARQFIAHERDNVRNEALRAQAAIDARLRDLPPGQQTGRLGRSLSDRSVQLGVLAAASPSDVAFSRLATPPTSASSPKTQRNVAFGVVLGLLLGVGLALLAERVSTRVRDSAEIETLFDRPVLAELPESKAFRGRPVSFGLLPESAWEAFRMLRARMQAVGKGQVMGSVLFTSCASGDGKSTVARHFAAGAALIGVKTVLVEADLRSPTLGADGGLRPAPGLADALERDLPISAVIQEVDVSERGVAWEDSEHSASLAAVVAGAAPLTAPELLASNRLAEVLDQLAAEYDLVVVDAPSPLEVSDAVPLLGQVDSVVVVIRVGVTRREAARRLSRLLSEANAPVVGAVANGARTRSPRGYGYVRRARSEGRDFSRNGREPAVQAYEAPRTRDS